jgi:3-deoxy-D-manno-octulosonic-acid transferase
MGARTASVRAVGNLKYDVRAPQENATRARIQSLLSNAPLVIAGSTLEGEEAALLAAWPAIRKAAPSAVLLLAPRHPERFAAVLQLACDSGHPFLPCSQLTQDTAPFVGGTILVLDTLGDLAAIYSLGAVAFVGGSLVPRGGHNPLEPAQFRVPIVMGPSFQNFRDIVASLQSADAIRIVRDKDELQTALIELLNARPQAEAMGERGHRVFEQQQGATARTVEALLPLVQR